MRKMTIVMGMLFLVCGCAQMCEFGTAGDASGFKCRKLLASAEVGMSQKEVQDQIGVPSQKRVDVAYRGKTYEEVWVYNSTPPTILYFKNGYLEYKEFQD